MCEQLELWQTRLVERLREWRWPAETGWLDALLAEIAWMIASVRRA